MDLHPAAVVTGCWSPSRDEVCVPLPLHVLMSHVDRHDRHIPTAAALRSCVVTDSIATVPSKQNSDEQATVCVDSSWYFRVVPFVGTTVRGRTGSFVTAMVYKRYVCN